jgi:hypothetical protein
MASRVLGTPSVLLVSESLDEHDLYARTLRAYGYRVVKAPTSGAAHLIAITRPTDDVSRPQDADLDLKAGANMVLESSVRADVLQAEVARLLRS